MNSTAGMCIPKRTMLATRECSAESTKLSSTAKPVTVHAETMMATRFHARRRVRCSLRNSDSSGSGKRSQRNPLASNRAASELVSDELFVEAMLRKPADVPPGDQGALYVFGLRGASRVEH